MLALEVLTLLGRIRGSGTSRFGRRLDLKEVQDDHKDPVHEIHRRDGEVRRRFPLLGSRGDGPSIDHESDK